MAFGRKTGGREAGTPNRRTVEVQERLEALGCDPIVGMARIAMDPATPLELQARMYAERAPYCYPKRKAIEYSAADDAGVIVIRWAEGMPPKDLTDEELNALIAARHLALDAHALGGTAEATEATSDSAGG